jgi:hypothetical protein
VIRLNCPHRTGIDLWEVQERLDFPGTVYGVSRGTSMREIMRRQSGLYSAEAECASKVR